VQVAGLNLPIPVFHAVRRRVRRPPFGSDYFRIGPDQYGFLAQANQRHLPKNTLVSFRSWPSEESGS